MLNAAQDLFEAGQYEGVVTTLMGSAGTPREYTVLGMSLLRLTRFTEAETPLIKASVLGDHEGQVELGNLLRLLGRFAEACAHFESISPNLTGEVQLRCQRWWGVAQFQLGESQAGLKRVERAWYGYMSMGDEALIGRVTQSLGQMHAKIGNHARAMQLYQEAANALSGDPDPIPRLHALKGLLDVQVEGGDYAAAGRTLMLAKALLPRVVGRRHVLGLMTSEAELKRLSGDAPGYAAILEELYPRVRGTQEHDVRLWVTARLADRQSLLGQHGKAQQTLHSFGRPEDWPPELLAVSGVLARRRGSLYEATADLDSAAKQFSSRGRDQDMARALLHSAAAHLELKAEVSAAERLKRAFGVLLSMRQLNGFQPDFEELGDLLHYALLEPDLAPYMEPLLDHLGHLLVGPRLPEDGAMHLQLRSLGAVGVYRDNAPIRFALSDTPLLLAYLALNPERTRAEIQLDLYPDKEPATGSTYMRRMLRDLRMALGNDVIHFSGPHNSPSYRLGNGVRLEFDFVELLAALERGELARALALYRGEFMPAPDISEADESPWLREKREEARLGVLFMLREQMAQDRRAGNFKRLVLLANRYLIIDPFDRDVLETRVEAASVHAKPVELARYTAALRGMFN